VTKNTKERKEYVPPKKSEKEKWPRATESRKRKPPRLALRNRKGKKKREEKKDTLLINTPVKKREKEKHSTKKKKKENREKPPLSRKSCSREEIGRAGINAYLPQAKRKGIEHLLHRLEKGRTVLRLEKKKGKEKAKLLEGGKKKGKKV